MKNDELVARLAEEELDVLLEDDHFLDALPEDSCLLEALEEMAAEWEAMEMYEKGIATW